MEAARANPRPLIESCFKVITKGLGGMPPVSLLKLNKPQLRVDAAIQKARAMGIPPRIIVLKARQPGISTLCAGYIFSTAFSRPFSQSMIVAHLDESAEKLFAKTVFMLEQLPADFRPTFRPPRKDHLTLDGMVCLDGVRELRSSIMVGTASGHELWRGLTLQAVHLSEFARFPYPRETLLGILQSVPATADSLVVIESTAQGMGDVFHQEWCRAEAGESGFIPVFIPWYELPDAELPVPPGFVLTPEEQALMEQYPISLPAIVWRRWKLGTECGGDLDLFNQEFPTTPASAFLVTGRPCFPIGVLQELYDVARTVPMRRGRWNGERGFVPFSGGELVVWSDPKPGHEYVVSADPSEGTASKDSDPACIQVFDRTEERQVAEWHGKVTPNELADIMIGIGRWYNTAILAPELQGGHGYVIIEVLKERFYPNIYVYTRTDRIKGSTSNFLGWECVDPASLILTADLEWVRADSIRVGDEVLGCGEQVSGLGRGSGIPIRLQTVTDVQQFRAPRVDVELEDGTCTRVSENHPLLVMRNSRKDLGWQWMVASRVHPGDSVKVFPTWVTDRSYEAGRLSAFLDGEGHLSRRGTRDGGFHMLVSQSEGALADEIVELWKRLGFAAAVKRFRRERRPHEKVMITSGMIQVVEVLRALGRLRPTRLLRKFREFSRQTMGTLRAVPAIKVRAVRPAGRGAVVGLTTNPDHTLIADGVVGHNTNHRTRTLMIDSMHWALANRAISILSPECIREAMEFQRHHLTGRPEGLGHDDRIIALMIAYRVHLESPMQRTGMPPRVNIPGEELGVGTSAAKAPEGTGDVTEGLGKQVWDEVERELSKRKAKSGPSWMDYAQPDSPIDLEDEGEDWYPPGGFY